MKKSLPLFSLIALLPLLSAAQNQPSEAPPARQQAAQNAPKIKQGVSNTFVEDETAGTDTDRHTNPPGGGDNPVTLLGHNPSPDQPGIIQIKYALKIRGIVRLQIMDKAGHPLRTLMNEVREKGSYIFDFDPEAYFLQPGEYIYRLDTGGRIYSRPIRWE